MPWKREGPYADYVEGIVSEADIEKASKKEEKFFAEQYRYAEHLMIHEREVV